MQPVGGNFGDWGQGACLSQEPVGRTVRAGALGLEISLGKRTARVWLARLITFLPANSPADPALTLNWGGCGDAGWAKPEKFPPDAEGAPRCVSDAGFCFLIANSTPFCERWNLGEAPRRGAFGVGGDGKTFFIARGYRGALFLGARAYIPHCHKALG